ncbi:hypothetical protein [Paraburkholderia sp. Ac-20342]|uniref:hypothetical protein n=1 Tax=Paraburkholderia sp. Ac-20342 TaxID=2703889 RepID=UPI001F11D79B|nr:hypothetical protein [Paraburkholderia sp. Ac-20342]
MLELSTEQVTALAQLEAKRYVEQVRQDLVAENPQLAKDQSLASRLWQAYGAARHFGIASNDNVAAFLRLEAYVPGFCEKPATRSWITRPGRSPDERFHDYLRVIRWRIDNPGFKGGMIHGGTGGTTSGGSSDGAGSGSDSRWRRFIGWRRGGGSGQPV